MGKGGRCVRLTTVPPSCAIVMKSGNLNFLEPSGPLHACNGTALPLPLTIYHQNVRRLRRKANKFLSQLHPNFPHMQCFSEHHMNPLELQQTFIDNYKLGVSYCRTLYEKGGVCIFVQESLRYVKIDMENHCKDKNSEVCAINIYLNTKCTCIIAIYRAPKGNFELFISK